MTKRRGNKTSTAHRAERQAREIELMNAGKTQADIAAELGISRQTFWRDMTALTTSYTEGNQTAFGKLREMQVGALLDMAREVHEGKIEPEVGNSIRSLLDSVSKLLGLNAPTKSLSVSATVDAHDIRYLKFKKAVSGLTETQLEDVLGYATKLPRVVVETVKDASWFPTPEPKKLGDGQS
ncbi:MAG TPA: hypothetical protein VGR71_05670 [Nitrospira sp.]|nr:hypothetical protein [Nitrospira sp.]